MRKKVIGIVGAVALLLAVGTASGAVVIGFTDTVSISFGEVTYEESPLEVTSTELVGPGNTVDTVQATVDNTASASLEANTSVYLMDDGSVVAQGSSVNTIGSDGTTDEGNAVIEISVDEIDRSRIDALDITVKET
ncbi:hypothetical protein EKH57_15830 [Halorubrum sp. BOL3-1]|uniref:hypothetical protein n=1 Tax=Halorubrum sp. BOL3-1 TaxID=2497325 RepID=UPI0010052246|nr:hypothetical protein [Halorubrum sp. BOL3-1]QAU14052.1 hypothetical protein EKH57_15830 [Halorubrum sp. BOL3-1]